MAKQDTDTETVTYVPGQGDPATVKWAGQTFHANVGKELTGDPNGTEQQRLNHHIITTVRVGHPHFTAGGAKKSRVKVEPPKTAEEYRLHVAKWLQDKEAIDEPEKLIAKFSSERDLQSACDVGASDYEMIGQLVMARLGDLAKATEKTEQQVAMMWLNHGYTQLPW